MCGALVLRLVWIVAERNVAPRFDGNFYYGLAKALGDGKGFIHPALLAQTGQAVPSANHTPAWPLVLTVPQLLGLGSRLQAQLCAAFVGTVTVGAMGFAGRAVAGPRVGLVAAGIAAVYPSFWVYEHELMSETLALLLIAILIVVAYRFRSMVNVGASAVLGGLIGVLSLTHPNHLLLIPLLCAPLIWFTPHAGRRRRLVRFAVVTVVAAAVVAPWILYNAGRFREPVYMTTGVGYTLATANCPFTYYGPHMGSWGLLCPRPVAEGADASQADNEWRRQAQTYIRSRERRVPLVVAAREGRTFAIFRPFQQARIDAQWGSALWVEQIRLFLFWIFTPLAVFGAVVLRRRHVTLIPILALVAEVILTVAVSFGDTRFRAPVEVVIALLAAVALTQLWSTVGRGPRLAEPA